jgi:hypothetical protein
VGARARALVAEEPGDLLQRDTGVDQPARVGPAQVLR